MGWIRCDLDDSSEDHDDPASDDCSSSTKLVTDNEDENSTDQAPDLVYGRNETLDRAVVPSLFEHVRERWGRYDATHHTLIITE
jgi:hypothetical protein